MKNILSALVIFTLTLHSQPNERSQQTQSNSVFSSTVISIPAETSVSTYYLYKVPYNLLVFEKAGKDYVANVRVQAEIYDSTNTLVLRDLKNSRIFVDRFELTIDRNNALNDFIEFKLEPGKYEIRAIVSDLNTDRELRLPPEVFSSSSINEEKILRPLIISTQQVQCETETNYSIMNSSGIIPFAPQSYSLMIPVLDTAVEELFVYIVQDTDTITFPSLKDSFDGSIAIQKCNESLILKENSESSITRNFILKNVNMNLYEGRAELLIKSADNSVKQEFVYSVAWINKPLSLMDTEQAIKFLKFIEKDNVISELLSNSSSKYSSALMNYWKKFDPDTESSFNPLMQEYYERIDYAVREFRGLGKDSGLNTDRGKVYIRFGRPTEISRSSDMNGKVTETWNYSNPERKFTFVDMKGTGNFILVEG